MLDADGATDFKEIEGIYNKSVEQMNLDKKIILVCDWKQEPRGEGCLKNSDSQNAQHDNDQVVWPRFGVAVKGHAVRLQNLVETGGPSRFPVPALGEVGLRFGSVVFIV